MRLAAASLLCLVPVAVGAQSSTEHLVVRPDSAAVRAVYEQPMPRDLHAVLIAREKLRIAGHAKATGAVDAYLAYAGLLELHGREVPAAGSIGDMVSAPPQADAELVARILETWLMPRAPTEAGAAVVRKGTLEVPVEIVHAGRGVITQFDAELRIEGVRDALHCRPESESGRMQPGEARLHVCRLHGADEMLRDAAQHARAALENPSRWKLRPVRINFAQPAVNFGSNGIYYWLRGDDARQLAILELRQAGCRARGSCLADLGGAIGEGFEWIAWLVTGFPLGFAIGRATRRPGAWGFGVTLLSPAIFAAGWVMLSTSAATTTAFMGLALAGAAVAALLTFIPVMWIGIVMGARARRAKAT